MTAPDGRRIGLAHLSMISAPPPALVEFAAGAGFDFVGLRVRAVTPEEAPYDLQPGSPLLKETIARLTDHDMMVRDVEFLLLDGTDQREDWLRMFEAGQALGASSLTVAVGDDDDARVADTLARMAEDGRDYEMTPTIEPISYQAVRSVDRAHALAIETGCDVLIDTLHVARFGGTARQIAAAASSVPLVQLCDAPAVAPAGREALIEESRAHRAAPGEGGLDLAGVVAAVEAGLQGTARDGSPLPVSVEVPDPAARARLGDEGWTRHLHASAVTMLGAVRPGLHLDNPDGARVPAPAHS